LLKSYKEDGRPAQQWYWDDWFSAFDVRLCSLAARGLWIDMLGIMWKAEIRGTLTVNGKQMDNKTLAKIVSSNIAEIKPLLKELENNKVFSRLEDGTVICRRVFNASERKSELSRIRSAAGSLGAKKRWQDNIAKDKKPNSKKMAKIATSSATPPVTPTSSLNTIDGKTDIDNEFEEFWVSYKIMKKKKNKVGNKQEAYKAFKALRKKIGKDELIKALWGEADYLKYERLVNNFDKRKKYASTWLRSDKWREHKDFKYTARL